MAQADDKENNFPEGYEHVQERLNETTERLQSIDNQIENIPQDQGPQIIYKPPGFIGSRQPGTRDQTTQFLRQQQDQLKVDTLAKTEADTRNAENKTGRSIRDQVREELFPNPFRGVSQEEMQQYKEIPKEIEQSQDYMDAKLVAAAAQRSSPTKQKIQTPIKQDKADLSMSARFSMSLGYTKALENTDPAPTPSRDQDKDRD
ncbi:hypothetical protein [Spirosoma daeguense]